MKIRSFSTVCRLNCRPHCGASRISPKLEPRIRTPDYHGSFPTSTSSQHPFFRTFNFRFWTLTRKHKKVQILEFGAWSSDFCAEVNNGFILFNFILFLWFCFLFCKLFLFGLFSISRSLFCHRMWKMNGCCVRGVWLNVKPVKDVVSLFFFLKKPLSLYEFDAFCRFFWYQVDRFVLLFCRLLPMSIYILLKFDAFYCLLQDPVGDFMLF